MKDSDAIAGVEPQLASKIAKIFELVAGELKLYSRTAAAPTREDMADGSDAVVPTGEDITQLAKEFSRGGSHTYKVYLQMLIASSGGETVNEEINALAKLMFGRRIADFYKPSLGSKVSPVSNPYGRQIAYHRMAPRYTPASLSYLFLPQDAISTPDTFYYYPIASRTIPLVEEIIKQFYPHGDMTVLPLENSVISYIKYKSEQLTSVLNSFGLRASMWDMAIAAATTRRHDLWFPEAARLQWDVGVLFARAPGNVTELRASKALRGLKKIAENHEKPTHLLAICLYNLLCSLPDKHLIYDEEDTKHIIRRIYIFLEMTVGFYSNDYSRFAFGVYCIVHEISLLLYKAQKRQAPFVSYSDFVEETMENAVSAFGLPLDGEAYSTICAPANSGAHACMIAILLARKMQISEARLPSICFITPVYYEFDESLKPLDGIKLVGEEQDPDIYMISTGPIMFDLGVDLNKFIRQKVLKTSKKHVTIVIDTTSGFYARCNLDEDVKQLVKEGRLSLIVHASHQKFALLHSDQPQYGRVFGLCSKTAFSPETISEFNGCAEHNFHDSLDIKVSTFISRCSGKILEQIKRVHFFNTELLRDAYAKFNLASEEASKTEEDIANREDIYFLPGFKNAKELISARGSFGHYETVGIGRISPGASDPLDNIIDATYQYLYESFALEDLANILSKIPLSPPGCIVEAVISLGTLMAMKAKVEQQFAVGNFHTVSDECLRLMDEKLQTLSHLPYIKGRTAIGHLSRFFLIVDKYRKQNITKAIALLKTQGLLTEKLKEKLEEKNDIAVILAKVIITLHKKLPSLGQELLKAVFNFFALSQGEWENYLRSTSDSKVILEVYMNLSYIPQMKRLVDCNKLCLERLQALKSIPEIQKYEIILTSAIKYILLKRPQLLTPIGEALLPEKTDPTDILALFIARLRSRNPLYDPEKDEQFLIADTLLTFFKDGAEDKIAALCILLAISTLQDYNLLNQDRYDKLMTQTGDAKNFAGFIIALESALKSLPWLQFQTGGVDYLFNVLLTFSLFSLKDLAQYLQTLSLSPGILSPDVASKLYDFIKENKPIEMLLQRQDGLYQTKLDMLIGISAIKRAIGVLNGVMVHIKEDSLDRGLVRLKAQTDDAQSFAKLILELDGALKDLDAPWIKAQLFTRVLTFLLYSPDEYAQYLRDLSLSPDNASELYKSIKENQAIDSFLQHRDPFYQAKLDVLRRVPIVKYALDILQKHNLLKQGWHDKLMTQTDDTKNFAELIITLEDKRLFSRLAVEMPMLLTFFSSSTTKELVQYLQTLPPQQLEIAMQLACRMEKDASDQLPSDTDSCREIGILLKNKDRLYQDKLYIVTAFCILQKHKLLNQDRQAKLMDQTGYAVIFAKIIALLGSDSKLKISLYLGFFEASAKNFSSYLQQCSTKHLEQIYSNLSRAGAIGDGQRQSWLSNGEAIRQIVGSHYSDKLEMLRTHLDGRKNPENGHRQCCLMQ